MYGESSDQSQSQHASSQNGAPAGQHPYLQAQPDLSSIQGYNRQGQPGGAQGAAQQYAGNYPQGQQYPGQPNGYPQQGAQPPSPVQDLYNRYPLQDAGVAPQQGAQAVPGAPQYPWSQPVPAEAPSKEPEASKEPQESYVEHFKDPISRSLVQGIETLASSKGVDLAQAFGPAYEAGNPEYINYAYLQSVAPELAQTLAQQATALIQHESSRSQQTVESVYQMAGGQEQWGQAAQQFSQNAPEEVRAVIRNLLDSGDPNSLKYAVNTVLQFAQGSGTVPYGSGQMVNPMRTSSGAVMNQRMTREAFQKAEQELSKQYQPGTAEYQRQFQYLASQRMQARQQGI